VLYFIEKEPFMTRNGAYGFSGEDDIAKFLFEKLDVHLELRRRTDEALHCKPVKEMRHHPHYLSCVEFVRSLSCRKVDSTREKK